MPINSNTADVNMVNITFVSAVGNGNMWQTTDQMIPRGVKGDPVEQLARLKEMMPHVNNLRLLFNDYSFNPDGSLHPAYEAFLTAAAAEGYQITMLYSGGDVQNIGLPGWVADIGQTSATTTLTNAQAYAALQAQFVQTQASWTKMMNWLDAHGAVKSAVWGYELMNEAAGYKHTIQSNGAGGGYSLASFVKLYADHNIALAQLIEARAAGNILVDGWGYAGDFETLNSTLVNGQSALAYIKTAIGSNLVWSAHLYPGWAGADGADPTAMAAILEAHFAPLAGSNVIVTETNAKGDVDDLSQADDATDFLVASYEWFSDNGIGIGWFPFNSTGESAMIWFDTDMLQVRHQHSLAHGMNAFSLGEDPPAHAGNENLTAATTEVRLRNEDFQQQNGDDASEWDGNNGTDVGLIGWAFGYAGNDTLTGTNMSNDFMYGGTGNDGLSGLGGDDFLFGQDGNDVLRGAGDDYLFGGRGNDTLSSVGGRDYMTGGAGNDTFIVDSANDVVREFVSHGTDTIQTATLTSVSLADRPNIENITYTGSAAFSGTGNAAGNVISSGAGADSLVGAGGNDKAYGGAGSDSLYGGGGSDRLTGGTGGDRLDGGAGSDWASYWEATAAVNADLVAGQTVLKGEAAGDIYVSIENLQGGGFNDTLRGDDQSNNLRGEGGNDRLWARGGNDTMTGGAGADVFAFETGYDADRITDFENDVDEIFFSKMGFTSVTQAMSYASQSGTSVVFNFGNGDTLTVLNTTLAVLTNDILI